MLPQNIPLRLFLVGGLVVLLAAASSSLRSSPIHVDSAVATRGSIATTVEADCKLDYLRRIELRPEITGKVVAVRVRPGDSVALGDELVQIEPASLRSTAAQAAAQLETSLEDVRMASLEARLVDLRLARRQALASSGFYPKADLLESEIGAQQAKAKVAGVRAEAEAYRSNLDRIRAELGKTSIRAPLDGIVTSVDIEPGETAIASAAALPGSMLVTIADTGAGVAHLQIDEASAGRVAQGMEVSLHVAGQALDLAGRVSRIDEMVSSDPRSSGWRYVAAEVAFPIAGRLPVQAGTACSAEIMVKRADRQLLVPVQAVQYDGGVFNRKSGFVWLLDRGTIRRRNVVIALQGGEQVAIGAGLRERDRVVTGPSTVLAKLADGVQADAD